MKTLVHESIARGNWVGNPLRIRGMVPRRTKCMKDESMSTRASILILLRFIIIFFIPLPK